MGDGVRTSSYDRNTTLDQDDILEKCVRRAYAKDSKASILEELIDKILNGVWENSDSEYGDREVFAWVMGHGNKEEKAHIDQRMCDEKNPLCIDAYQYEDCLDELPRFKAKLEKKDSYADMYNEVVGED